MLEGANHQWPWIRIQDQLHQPLSANSMVKPWLLVIIDCLQRIEDNRPNPTAKELSDFSGWGVTTDGQLKPRCVSSWWICFILHSASITYGMEQVSMASPHVAG